jgi:predicted ester cyclase
MLSALDVAKTHHDAYNSRAFETDAHEYVDANWVHLDIPTGQEFHGVEGYQQYNGNWAAAFPDSYIKILERQASGNTVISSFVGHGTFTGQLATPQGVIPGNGRSVTLECREELEVRNGKIVRSSLEYDLDEMMRQLGLA